MRYNLQVPTQIGASMNNLISVIPWTDLEKDIRSGAFVGTPYEVLKNTYSAISFGHFHQRAHHLLRATLADPLRQRRGILARISPDKTQFLPENQDSIMTGDAFSLSFPVEFHADIIEESVATAAVACWIQSRAANVPDTVDIFSQLIVWHLDPGDREAILRQAQVPVLPRDVETILPPMISLIATPYKYYAFVRTLTSLELTQAEALHLHDNSLAYYQKTVQALSSGLNPHSKAYAQNEIHVLSTIADSHHVAMYVADNPGQDLYVLQRTDSI